MGFLKSNSNEGVASFDYRHMGEKVRDDFIVRKEKVVRLEVLLKQRAN